jgi:hypothetical protein
MNPVETYFQVLTLSSHGSPVGASHEGVTPYALAQFMGLAHAQLQTWRNVSLSRTKVYGVTQLRRLLWCD